MYANGNARIGAQTGGVAAIISNANTDAENRYLGFTHANLTLRGIVGHNTGIRFATLMRILSQKNGGTFVGLNTISP